MKNNEQHYFIKKAKRKNNVTQNAYYDNFTAYLQSKNLQASSIERYKRTAEHFVKWLSEHKDITPENTEKKDLLNYLQYLQEKQNLTAKTRQFILGIMRHYYAFLQLNGGVENNFANTIKLRGTRKNTLNKILSLEEMNELLDIYYQFEVRTANDEDKHFYKRNHLVLSLFIYQGLKRSEVTTLTFDDINLYKATINIHAKRRSNARTLPLQASQTGLFYDYLNNNQNNRLMNESELHKLSVNVKKLYPKFTGFNQLRTSLITHWVQTDGLRKAQYKAGHRYISSTEKFTANDIESLKDDINRFHPI